MNKPSPADYSMDPVLMAVLANRLNAIVREMSNTLLRTARSTVLAIARDFSCSITTSENQLLCAGEGLPIHIFGSGMQSQSMCDLHNDLAPGDAFLDNDPYTGNTHPADHTILCPVFIGDEHLFTTCAKAHQADCGNSIPTTYHAYARDVYEEGALIFPCIRVQQNYQDVDDIIRICKKRIRVPEQWFGDYLAAIGAARIGERRLLQLTDKYGKETLQQFVSDWFNYSERRMVEAIKKLPGGKLSNIGHYDPQPPVLPKGLKLRVDLSIDAKEGRIEVDLTKNDNNKDFGLNQSVACATSVAMAGVFNCLEHDIPHNAGSFSRVKVKLRAGCITGRPEFPHSCSVATTNIADRIVNITQAAFAKISSRHGLAEGGLGMGAGAGVISGKDWRTGGKPYINQEVIMANGGPGTPSTDGWLTYGLPVVGGLMYRNSVEVDESKYPIQFKTVRMLAGGGGAGRFRGSPGAEVIYGPRKDPMTVVVSCDGQVHPPCGVQGGHPGPTAKTYKINTDGSQTKLPGVIECHLEPGELIRGLDCGGGGYGDPLQRDPERVLKDVLEHWETVERANDIYGVVFVGNVGDETLAVDPTATATLRSTLAAD